MKNKILVPAIFVILYLISTFGCEKNKDEEDNNINQNSDITVIITSPLNEASYAKNSNIEIVVTITGEITIVNVEFYSADNKLGEDRQSPYALLWENVITGEYSLKAKAIDEFGNEYFSESINITVSAEGNISPVVSIISPTNGATTTIGTIPITVEVDDEDGSVEKVEIFNGSELLGETTETIFNWECDTEGSYTLTAIATDDEGAKATSEDVTFTVTASVGSWEVIFGNNRTKSYEIEPTTDGNYLVLGINSEPNPDVLLFYTIDKSGNKISETENNSSSSFAELIQTNTGYLISGSKDDDIWLMSLDNSLNSQFYRTYGSSSSAEKRPSIVQLNDGNYIIAFDTDLNYDISKNDLCLTKTNSSGDVLWTSNTYGDLYGDYMIDVIESTDNKIMVLAVIQPSDEPISTYGKFWLLKFDQSGDREWEKRYGPLDETHYFPVGIVKSGSGYLLVGRNGWVTGNTVIVKTDANGNELVFNIIEKEGRIYNRAIAAYPDGGVIIAGNIGNKAFLLKVNSSGNEEWHETFGKDSEGDINWSSSFYDVYVEPDGIIMAVGNQSEEKWIDEYSPEYSYVNALIVRYNPNE